MQDAGCTYVRRLMLLIALTAAFCFHSMRLVAQPVPEHAFYIDYQNRKGDYVENS